MKRHLYRKLFLVSSNGLLLDSLEIVPLRFELHFLLPRRAQERVFERSRTISWVFPRSPRGL